MKLFRKKVNYGKDKKPASICAFHALSCVLFFSFLIFMALSILTGKRCLRNLAKCYVSSNEISRDYVLYFKDVGVSEDLAMEFLTSDEFRDIVVDVMTDKMIVLFRHKDTYSVTRETCEDTLYQVLDAFLREHQITLEPKDLISLKDYTMNMSGLSAMFVYNTPAAYRTSLFDDGSEYADLNNTFQILSEIASPVIPVVVFFMYIICVVLLFVFMWRYKEIIPYKAADTAIIPSIILLAFCFGELFCMKEPSTIQTYIFKTGIWLSLAGIIFGVLFFVLSAKLAKTDNRENISKE